MCLRIESITFCYSLKSFFLIQETWFFLWATLLHLSYYLNHLVFLFHYFLSITKYCFSSEKYCWGNTILMLLFYKISLSSDDLIWVSLSSEWCFGVAAVFKIGVVATSTIGVMLDELNWDGWPSKSVLSEISDQIPTSLSRGGGDLKPQSLH